MSLELDPCEDYPIIAKLQIKSGTFLSLSWPRVSLLSVGTKEAARTVMHTAVLSLRNSVWMQFKFLVFLCFRISILWQREAPVLSRLRCCAHLFRHQPPRNARQRNEKGLLLLSGKSMQEALFLNIPLKYFDFCLNWWQRPGSKVCSRFFFLWSQSCEVV